MAWEEIEFNCNDCNKFFIVRLHKRYGGKKVLVECPNSECKRKHPRTVNTSGTDMDEIEPFQERLYQYGEGKRLQRSGGQENKGEIILGLACTLSDESRFDKKNFAKDKRDKGGFLSRLWLKKAANEKA